MSKRINVTKPAKGDAVAEQVEMTRKELQAYLAEAGNGTGVPKSAGQVEDVNWWYSDDPEPRIVAFLVRLSLTSTKQAVQAVRTFFEGILTNQPDALDALTVRQRRIYTTSADRVDAFRRELTGLVINGLYPLAADPASVEQVVAQKQAEVEEFVQRYAM